MKSAGIWLMVLLIGLTLLVAGIQGSFGLVLATIFVPGDLVVDGGDSSSTGSSTPQGGGGGGTTNPNCSQPNNNGDCSCPGMAGSWCSDLWGFMPGICVDGKCVPL